MPVKQRSSRKLLGSYGEDLAVAFLLKRGYQIVSRNFRTRWGEIDIVAKKKDKISFIEVKTRRGITMGKPYEAVSRIKVLHMRRAAEYFILINRLSTYRLSLDAVSIIVTDSDVQPHIELYENIVY